MQLHSQTGFRPKPINVAKAVLYNLMPPGSVMKVPDSLWQSYIYASLLSGSALRGCRVLVIAPTQDSAPSAGAPQLARAHGLMGRLIVFGNELEQPIAAAGGLLKVGLYAPRQGVGDIAGRIAQSMDTEPGWSDRVYPFHRDFAAAADKVPAQLDSLGYSVRYLAATDSIAQPKMHLKANFFASKIAWDKLIARPEWAGLLREYVAYLAKQAAPATESDAVPDVQAIPERLHARGSELIHNFVADLTPQEYEQLVYYFTVGSVNMDYRSMCFDGEVMVMMSGWQSLTGIMDFFLLAGLCEWLETTEELDVLLPAPGGMMRSMSSLIKLML